MNYIDIIICIPLVWGLYKGFTKGLIVEAASLIAFGLGVWGSVHFSTYIAEQIRSRFDWQSEYLPIVSFAITFLLIVVAIFLLAKLLQHLVEGMALSAVNKLGGALFGALKFAFLMSVVIYILNAVEKSYPIVSIKAQESSLLYEPTGKIAPFFIPALKNTQPLESLLPSANDIDVDVNVKVKTDK